MKKQWLQICFIFIACVFMSSFLFSDDLTKKVGNLENGYRLFEGFDFSNYKPSPIGVDARVKAEVNHVIAEDKAAGKSGTYGIVGHSQGGLRVLAYATELKKQNKKEYDRLDAVITVSGIDKGLKALNGGFPSVKSRLMSDVNTLLGGFRSMVGVLDNPFSALVNLITDGPMKSPSDFNSTGVINLVLRFLPENLSVYLKPALNNASPDSMAEIRDMFPRSAFINNYVSKTTEHKYKVQTGTVLALVTDYFKVFGVKVYYVKLVQKPVYTTFTAYEDKPLFGNEMPVGYIVGLNNNTLSMVDKKTEQTIRDVVDGFKTGFDITYGIHIAKNIFFLGWLSNGIQYANDAKAARDWCKNFDGELNEIKCSPENDGLVAKESQFYPKTFTDPNTKTVRNVHTNVLGKDPKGYVGFPKYNHANIIEAEEVLQKIDEMLFEAKGKRVY